MTQDKIVIDNVSMVFSGATVVEALKNITCSIAEKEFTVFLGPSGCGKTTLLNLIAGLDIPTEGKLYLDGKEITEPGLDRGYVFQEYALFPWLDVFKNIEFGLKRKGIPKEERVGIVRKHINLVGLQEFERSYPHQLSGGMRQRVAIARALALDPAVLLMDEPFGALDAQTRLILQEELLRILAKTTKTVIFVTHSIEESLYLGQKIFVFTRRPGRIKRIVDVEKYINKEKYNFDRSKIVDSPEFIQLRTNVWASIKEELELT